MIQDRLQEPIPLDIVTKLLSRADFKASVIRQHLTMLFASSGWTTMARLPVSEPNRIALIRLVGALFHASPYISCQPAFIEPLLDVYRGSNHPSDKEIFEIFKLFEKQTRTSSASVLCRWRGSGVSSRSSATNALDAIRSLDSQKVFATCILFESRRTDVDLEEMLDPEFLLCLFGAFLYTEVVSGLDWVEILRSKILSVAIVGLSSKKEEMRSLSSALLATALKRIEVCFTSRL